MSDAMTLDLSGYAVGPMITELANAVISYQPSRLFVADTTIFLATQFDRALEQIESLKENTSLNVRGQEVRGWAQKTIERPRYGDSELVGTRGYTRKFRRGVRFLGPKKAKYYNVDQKDRIRGTLGNRTKARNEWENMAVKDRPSEFVWNRRASGALYSESSKLLQDNGAFRQALIAMNVTVLPGLVEFRPGGGVAYFDAQNSMRPIFVFYEEDDGATIAAFMEADIAALLMQHGVQLVRY